MTKLTMIEGIGSANAEKMFIAGIQTTEALLEAGAPNKAVSNSPAELALPNQ